MKMFCVERDLSIRSTVYPELSTTRMSRSLENRTRYHSGNTPPQGNTLTSFYATQWTKTRVPPGIRLDLKADSKAEETTTCGKCGRNFHKKNLKVLEEES